MPWLINAAQLDKFRKNQKALMIFDASWHLPDANRDAKQEFIVRHIIDSHFFDIDTFHNPDSGLPHQNMLLEDPTIIGEKLAAHGIRNDYKIIFYDNSNLHTACRALWMMKVFGHNPQQLYLLDGGIGAWEQYGGKFETGATNPTPRQYKVNRNTQFTRNLADLKQNVIAPSEQVVDLRHAVRFAGGNDPRPLVRKGHIKKSFSLPSHVLFEKDNTFRPVEKLKTQLTGLSLDLKSPIISMCGSGMTAPILDFALDLLGHTNHSVYNGSWAEWGSSQLYKGETDLSTRPVHTCLDD